MSDIKVSIVVMRDNNVLIDSIHPCAEYSEALDVIHYARETTDNIRKESKISIRECNINIEIIEISTGFFYSFEEAILYCVEEAEED